MTIPKSPYENLTDAKERTLQRIPEIPDSPGQVTERPGALPALVRMDTVAEALGVTERHIRRLVAERRIPFVKVGYFVRFDPREVARWLDAHRVEVLTPRGRTRR